MRTQKASAAGHKSALFHLRLPSMLVMAIVTGTVEKKSCA
jgi:hypothetical protein